MEISPILYELTALNAKVYSLAFWIVPEDGGFYGIIADLPGCSSDGRTVDECIYNLVEAFTGAVETYFAYYEEIPWTKNEEEAPKNAIIRHITVEVDSRQ
jgi:predicted RNase H-like HicB family nuclease